MKNEGVSTLKVAATYIGTVVGAGFATGQEVLQFFTRFGPWGLAGLTAITLLFILFGRIIMDLGRELRATSHLEIIRHAGGRAVGAVIDGIINFFLFGGLTAMIAGTGALFEQQFNLPGILGNILMAALTALTVLTGIHGVINSISIVVPFLLAAVIGVAVLTLFRTPPDLSAAPRLAGGGALISHWLLSAILYVSYNTVISVAVLGPLGVQARDRKAIRRGALLGGLGLGASSLMIYLALSAHADEIAGLEVPMIYIAGGIGPAMQFCYAVVLIAEVYTTAVGSLFGFVARITDAGRHPVLGRLLVIAAAIGAFIASQVGFSNLVKYLYPLVGYGGIMLLVCLLYVRFMAGSKWKVPHRPNESFPLRTLPPEVISDEKGTQKETHPRHQAIARQRPEETREIPNWPIGIYEGRLQRGAQPGRRGLIPRRVSAIRHPAPGGILKQAVSSRHWNNGTMAGMQ